MKNWPFGILLSMLHNIYFKNFSYKFYRLKYHDYRVVNVIEMFGCTFWDPVTF